MINQNPAAEQFCGRFFCADRFSSMLITAVRLKFFSEAAWRASRGLRGDLSERSERGRRTAGAADQPPDLRFAGTFADAEIL